MCYNSNKTLENIILQHSRRGIHHLRPYLSKSFCLDAAREILSLPKGKIYLTTGFYVNGFAETDGPPGTLCLALTLKNLGFDCTILTDNFCHNYFESFDLDVVYLNEKSPLSNETISIENIVSLISIERCGPNKSGKYANMLGFDIGSNTYPMDKFFLSAAKLGILTIGIGDGGNEIGMGKLADIISCKLSISPCMVETDHLIISSVSNWGAYGLSAYLSILSKCNIMPKPDLIDNYLSHLMALGCVDGRSGKIEQTVDGYPLGTEMDIYKEIYNYMTEELNL